MSAAEVLLAGEDVSFLRVLSFELSAHRITSRLVHERETMIAALAEQLPAMVVLDHVEPLDLFVLNPRVFGYSGSLLLLTHDPDSPVAPGLIQPTYVLHKRLLMRIVCEQIAHWLAEARPKP